MKTRQSGAGALVADGLAGLLSVWQAATRPAPVRLGA